MANAIDSFSYGDGKYVFTLPYGSCSTDAATAAKVVTVSNFSLETGARIAVKFTVTNTASSPTLNVNESGAKSIYYKGSAISASYLAANRTYEFIYNGTQWDLIGDVNTNTTYSNMTAATSSAAGKAGLVPAPAAGKQASFLRGDGTWVVPTNTTYSNFVKSGSEAAAGLVPAPSTTAGTTKYLREDGTWVVPPNTTYTSLKNPYSLTIQGNGTTLTNGTYDGSAAKTVNITPSSIGAATSGHTHNYAGSSSAGGSATSAVKLSTARTIALGTGATGTATSFDGSADITIPVTAVKESYLSWGGRNFSGSYGPIDAAMVPELGANRLAFMPASSITIEYSTDGGTTWTATSTSDTDKIKLFNGLGASLVIGNSSATKIDKSKYMIRATFESSSASVYTALNKFVIYCSTSGSTGSYCTISARTQANYSAGTDTWKVFADKVSISGWSGYNVINTSSITTYGNDNSHYRQVRFTFGVTSHADTVAHCGLTINKIMGFGGVGWNTPSTMAKYGRMYTYDASQNVTFPAKVTATTFVGALEGNAATATTATTAEQLNGGAASDNVARHVWFSHSSETGKRVYDDDFKYNPSTNVLTVGSISGSAAKLTTARTLSWTGDATGSLSFDGSANKSAALTLASSGVTAGSYGPSAAASPAHGGTFSVPYITVDAKGRVTAASTKTITLPASGNTDAKVLQSRSTASNYRALLMHKNNVESGTDPGSVTDQVYYNESITACPSTGELKATTFTGALSGNASTATKLATARTLSWTGDATGSLSFDGSANKSAALTLASSGVTAGSYGPSAAASPAHGGTFSVPYITVDAKGRVTAASTKTITLPADNNTTYSDATTSSNGLMTSAMVTKLNGITDSADSVAFSASLTSGTKVGTITINGTATDLYCETNTNTTYSNMTAATSSAAGKAGLVPAPAAGKQNSFLRGDGTWVVPTNTTYSNFVKSGSGAAAGLVPAPSTTAGTTKYLREDGTWTVPPNTTYSNATTSASGLMSASDKTKMDSLINDNLLLDSAKETTITSAAAMPEFSQYGIDLLKTEATQITLTFDAKADVATAIDCYPRNSGGAMTSYAKVVSVTTQWATYSVIMSLAADTYTSFTIRSNGSVTGGSNTAVVTLRNISIVKNKTASRLSNTAAIGSATKPVYFNENGVPVATTYTLSKSVPSDAKFTDTVYTHPSYTAKSSGFYKVTVDATGHVSTVTAVAKSDITGLGIPAQDTTYSNFVKSGSGAAAGLVPAPSTTAGTTKYLREDGTWTAPPNTTYSNMTAATSSAAGKAGLVPAPAAGKEGSYLRGDGTWATPTNTTYSAATTSAAGLMSAADKTKLDGIATGANAYSLPNATSSVLGGVKIGSNITVSSGTISLTKANVTAALGYTPPTSDTNTDTKVQIAANAPTSSTNYYPLMHTETSGTTTVTANSSTRFQTLTGTTSAAGFNQLVLGNSTATGTANNSYGYISLYSESTSYHAIKPASTTSAITHTLPATSGTVLNSGTTSFTQTLTSGTKIGSIKINGTSTDIYCETNTNTTYSKATSDTLGLVKIGYSTSGKNYAVQLNDSGQMYVNVPWTDNNTTYTSLKNPYSLTVQGNGTSSFTYDGSAAKTLNIKAGSNVTVTSDTSGNITIASSYTNTTYSNMTAATSSAAGKAGLVPAPAAGKQASFLRGDGTWATPTNTTYSNFVKSGSGAAAGLVPAPSTTAGTTKYLREDGTWTAPPNTTYSAATASANGLMSASDKSKLDAITDSADSVSFTQSLTSGTKVGTITINGTATDLYCETNTNTDTKVTVTENAPTSATNYYPTMHSALTGTTGLTAHANIRYNILEGTSSTEGIAALYLGYNTAKGTAGNSTGKILMYSDSTSYHWLIPASTSSVITHTLPATSGTILNSGTTSFTQSLTSGTKVGSIKINGTSTDIYAPTNTDTKNTAGSTDSSSKLFLIGATSQAANPQTYSHDTAYVGTDGCLYSNSKKVSVEGHTHSYAASDHTHSEYAASSHTHNYAASSSEGGSATSAVKLDTSTAGSSTQPVYFSSGKPTAGSTYAGGTKVTLNGTAKGASTASFYAPTDVGTSGQILTSNGSGAPSWKTFSSMAASAVTTASTDLNNYTTTGIYYFSQSYTPTNIPDGVNGWLVVYASGDFIKQLWYRHGTADSNDYHTWVRTRTSSSVWSSWSSYMTKQGGTFSGNVTFGSNAYFANGTTYYVNSSGNAKFNTITANSNVTIAGNVTMNNAKILYVKNSSGSTVEIAKMDSSNYIHIGGGASSILKIGNASNTSRTQIFSKGRIDILPNGTTDTGALNPAFTFEQTDSSNCATFRPTADSIEWLGNESYRWGRIYCTSGTVNTSDKRLKDNIKDLDERYVKLWDKLEPKSYNLIKDKDGKTRLGYIAQDIEEAANCSGLDLQDCGFIHKDWVSREDYEGYEYGLSYDDLSVLTTAKVKELEKELAEKEDRIKKLEETVALLLEKMNS